MPRAPSYIKRTARLHYIAGQSELGKQRDRVKKYLARDPDDLETTKYAISRNSRQVGRRKQTKLEVRWHGCSAEEDSYQLASGVSFSSLWRSSAARRQRQVAESEQGRELPSSQQEYREGSPVRPATLDQSEVSIQYSLSNFNLHLSVLF